ncbi:tetratricopeptide repeat protein [Candidatus Roizmanbacteria bacterium]|nr:tetratricopeptide repeat protein [Candidatus Roizmanbacteria bacterium]
MSSREKTKEFAELFWHLRTRSGFRSIREFSFALADYGIVFDESTYTRWQRGDRIPQLRSTLIAIIRCFIDHNSIQTLEDANAFLQLAGYGWLSDKEQKELFTPSTSMHKSTAHDLHENIVNLVHPKILEKHWNQLGPTLWHTGRWKKLRTIGSKLYTYLQQNNNQHLLARLCIQELSWLYYWQDDIDQALSLSKEGLTIAKDNHDLFYTAYAKQRLGKVYQAKKAYKESTELFLDSLKVFQAIGEDERAGDTLTYLAETYWLSGEKQKAVESFYEALLTAESLNDLPQVAIISSDLGGYMTTHQQFEHAEEYFHRSIHIAKQIGRRTGGDIWNNIGLGLIQERQHKQKNASVYFQKAQNEMEHLGITDIHHKNGVLMNGLRKELQVSLFYNKPSHS